VDILARRAIQSAHSRAEADGLARLAAETLALGAGSRSEMAAAVRRAFDLDAVAVFRRAASGWEIAAVAGEPVPAAPDDAPFQARLAGGDILVLSGGRLSAGDSRLLREFVTEIRLAQERRQLGHVAGLPAIS